MERAQNGLELAACERADIAPHCKLVIDNMTIYIMECCNRRVIGRGVGTWDRGDSEVKSVCEAMQQEGIPPL